MNKLIQKSISKAFIVSDYLISLAKQEIYSPKVGILFY